MKWSFLPLLTYGNEVTKNGPFASLTPLKALFYRVPAVSPREKSKYLRSGLSVRFCLAQDRRDRRL